MRELLADFRKFMMQGNVLDLAVAVVTGAAFKAIIDSLVADVIQPLIGAIFGKPDFSSLTVHVGNGVVKYGSFLTQIVNFLIIAASLFVVIRTFERLQTRVKRDGQTPETAPAAPTELDVLTEIRDALVARP